MRRDLTRLCAAAHPRCRRVLLPELTAITVKEVKDWLRENAIELSEARTGTLLATLFGGAGGAPEPRPMAAVETQLRRLLGELGDQTRGRYGRDHEEAEQ
jgi:hypothetical protein